MTIRNRFKLNSVEDLPPTDPLDGNQIFANACEVLAHRIANLSPAEAAGQEIVRQYVMRATLANEAPLRPAKGICAEYIHDHVMPDYGRPQFHLVMEAAPLMFNPKRLLGWQYLYCFWRIYLAVHSDAAKDSAPELVAA